MRKTFMLLTAAMLVASTLPAYAGLQTVTVGGEIRIRANYYKALYPSPSGWEPYLAGPGAELRIPGTLLPFRPIGDPVGGQSILSGFAFDDDENDLDFIEQRTRLNVQADFTGGISAFIELDSYDTYGEDFRSNYVTGADARAASLEDVEVYQAYIQAKDMWDMPLQVRIGRQELSLGSEWLVGVNDTSSGFRGLSFDGILVTYTADVFTVHAVYALLAEVGVTEQDGDITLGGLYGSYQGLEDVVLDAYWLWVRDPTGLTDTPFSPRLDFAENIFGLDDYDVTNVHTLGLRGAGTIGALDFEAEAAYQLGEADGVGFLFKPVLYGDDNVEFDEWAANLEVGYTFDMVSTPRIYVGLAYFGGEDRRAISFAEWLNPFDVPDASVSFHRLFSNWEYGEFLDFTHLSNAYVIRAGANASPAENIDVSVHVLRFETIEQFDRPLSVRLGDYYIPVVPFLSFWDQKNDDELGWEVDLYLTYHYSEDLSFELGYAHFFTGDGIREGQFSSGNGLAYIGGGGDDDADYVYLETRLAF